MYGDDNINNNDGDAHDAGDGDAGESKGWAELSGRAHWCHVTGCVCIHKQSLASRRRYRLYGVVA